MGRQRFNSTLHPPFGATALDCPAQVGLVFQGAMRQTVSSALAVEKCSSAAQRMLHQHSQNMFLFAASLRCERWERVLLSSGHGKVTKHLTGQQKPANTSRLADGRALAPQRRRAAPTEDATWDYVPGSEIREIEEGSPCTLLCFPMLMSSLGPRSLRCRERTGCSTCCL